MASNKCETTNNVKAKKTSKSYRNKDIKVAADQGIPIDIALIIDLPQSEFDDLHNIYKLTVEQQNTCRAIRRRGKNKIAAQNSRNRKVDHQEELESRLKVLKEKYLKLENTENEVLCIKQQKN